MGHYLHGIDCVGDSGVARPWDNHAAYRPGDVVYFSQKYWRAVRAVDPPLFPGLMDGEVPGASDAWRETTQEVLGDSGFGGSSWLSALKSLGGPKSPATPPGGPVAPVDKKREASTSGSTAFYAVLGVVGTAVAGLSGYLLWRRKRR